MKQDEFAFFNQQLAAMLRAGIPLEGALRQLCTSMRRGKLRNELQQVEEKLRRGVSLKDALASSRLPGFYVQMVHVGVASNDLPGVLTLVADYCQKMNTIWTRLKGLMVYPLIVLGGCLLLSGWLTIFVHQMGMEIFGDLMGHDGYPVRAIVSLWLPFGFIVAASMVVAVMLLTRRLRQNIQWRLPGFREAGMVRVAAAVETMLRGGCALPEALELAANLEAGSPAAREIQHWRQCLASGERALPAGRVFPPLFLWLVNSAGENVAEGFQRAAEIYQARAKYRVDLMLYAALPVAVMLLGGLVLMQVRALFIPLIQVLSQLGM